MTGRAGTGQRADGAEMRLDMSIGGHSLDVKLPGALLKIDVTPDGTATVKACPAPGHSVTGDPCSCMTIGPGPGW